MQGGAAGELTCSPVDLVQNLHCLQGRCHPLLGRAFVPHEGVNHPCKDDTSCVLILSHQVPGVQCANVLSRYTGLCRKRALPTCVEAHGLEASDRMLVDERVHNTGASITDWPQAVPLVPLLPGQRLLTAPNGAAAASASNNRCTCGTGRLLHSQHNCTRKNVGAGLLAMRQRHSGSVACSAHLDKEGQRCKHRRACLWHAGHRTRKYWSTRTLWSDPKLLVPTPLYTPPAGAPPNVVD